MCQLQLSLFGVPVVKHGETTLTFSTRKALALLVYLAVEGGLHTRKTLSEAFWAELDAKHGRPCSSCAGSSSALMRRANGLTCASSMIRLASNRMARSCWTFASSKLPASE
jgi:hypothetical protein